MSSASGSPDGYSVGIPARVRVDLRDITRRATRLGQGWRVTSAFEQVITWLGRSPREFGEPMYRLRGMRMEVRHGAVSPLYVEYGVHEEQPVVVIRRVRWLDDPAG